MYKTYIGVVELETMPYWKVVVFDAESVEKAKEKYETYCNKVGGYIYNLCVYNPTKHSDLYEIAESI